MKPLNKIGKYKIIIFFIIIIYMMYLIINIYTNIFEPKKYILVITNYAEKQPYFKYIKQAQKQINKTNDNIIWFNINYSQITDEKYKEIVRRKIKNILKEKQIIAVVDGSTSRTAELTLDLFPRDMPIITDSSSPYILTKFKGNQIFSISSIPYFSRGRIIYLLTKLLNKKNIVFILDEKTSPYSKVIYYSLFKRLKKDKIKLVKYSLIEFKEKNIIKKYGKKALYVIGIDSSSAIADFIYNVLDKEKGLDAFSIYYSSKKLKKIRNTRVFGGTFHNGKDPNFLEYKCLNNIDIDINNSYDLHRYFSVYRLYNSRINIIKSLINKKTLEQNNTHQIRKIINKKLPIYSKKVFVDTECSNYLFLFKKYNPLYFNVKDKNISLYFNSVLNKDIGLRNMYIKYYNPTSKKEYYYPIQYIFLGKKQKPKAIPTLSVEGKINKISILNLSTETASIDMYLILKYISKIGNKKLDFNYPNDLKILSKDMYIKKSEYSLIKTYEKKIDNFIFKYKIYRIKIFVPVINNLFFFPYDKFYLKLEVANDNFTKKPYFLSINNFYYKIKNSNLQPINLFSTYSEKIVYIEPDTPLIIPKNIILLELKRKNAIFVIIKYLLPAIVIMMIGLYIGYMIIRYDIEHDSKGIVSDTILGVISIYFVFSLLISIKKLVLMDIIFYFMISILSILLIIIFYKIKKSNLKNKKD